MRARMVSVGTVADPLRRAVRDIARAAGKQRALGARRRGHRARPPRARAAARAARRARPQRGRPRHRAARRARRRAASPRRPSSACTPMQLGAEVVIAVADDGRGIDVDRVRAERRPRGSSDADALDAIFRPGVSTAERVTGVSGRGVGLDAVRRAVEALRGRVEVRTAPGRGTEFRISVPMTLAVLRCLLVGRAAGRYALPMHSTATALPAPARGDGVDAEGRRRCWLGGEAIGLADLAARARHAAAGAAAAAGPSVVLTAARAGTRSRRRALGQRDVVVKDLGRLLPRLDAAGRRQRRARRRRSCSCSTRPGSSRPRARRRRSSTPPRRPSSRRRRRPPGCSSSTTRSPSASCSARSSSAPATRSSPRPTGVEAMRALAERPSTSCSPTSRCRGMDGFALTEAIRAPPSSRPAGAHPHLARRRGGPAARPRGGRRRLPRQERLRRAALLGAVRAAAGRVGMSGRACSRLRSSVEDSPTQRAHLVPPARGGRRHRRGGRGRRRRRGGRPRSRASARTS